MVSKALKRCSISCYVSIFNIGFVESLDCIAYWNYVSGIRIVSRESADILIEFRWSISRELHWRCVRWNVIYSYNVDRVVFITALLDTCLWVCCVYACGGVTYKSVDLVSSKMLIAYWLGCRLIGLGFKELKDLNINVEMKINFPVLCIINLKIYLDFTYLIPARNIAWASWWQNRTPVLRPAERRKHWRQLRHQPQLRTRWTRTETMQGIPLRWSYVEHIHI